jgi:hypothetical protein
VKTPPTYKHLPTSAKYSEQRTRARLSYFGQTKTVSEP